jgi:hypothetical protein
MPALLSLIIPALIPTFADAVRGVVNKLTNGAGAKPVNVDEQIKLMSAETEKMKALAALDAPAPNISKWVADLRASCRYIIAIVVVIAAVTSVYIPSVTVADTDLLVNLAGSVWSFLFGERMHISISRGRT